MLRHPCGSTARACWHIADYQHEKRTAWTRSRVVIPTAATSTLRVVAVDERTCLSARELAHALGGKSIGRGQWMAKCPSHQERTGSLSIKEGYSGPLVYCFGGCSQVEVIQALAGSRPVASLA